MIHFPDFTLPPINIYVMAQLEHQNHTQRVTLPDQKKQDAEQINRLLQMRNRG